jgi:hypothetical protein
MTLSTKGLFVTLSIKGTQKNNMMLSDAILSVIMLSVAKLSVVALSVAAPFYRLMVIERSN